MEHAMEILRLIQNASKKGLHTEPLQPATVSIMLCIIKVFRKPNKLQKWCDILKTS